MRTKITLVTKHRGGLCKRYTLSEGGLTKSSDAALTAGTFQTVEIDWNNFGSLLTSVQSNQAILLGVCKIVNGDGRPLNQGEITSFSRLKAAAQPTSRIVTRTKACFGWHGDGAYDLEHGELPYQCSVQGNVVMLDFDDLQGVAALEDLVAEFFQVFPELEGIPGGIWFWPSASSFIYQGDTQLVGLSGAHAYLLLPLEYKVDDLKHYLHIAQWIRGKGYIKVSKAGSALVRGWVDLATLSPERLDLIGPAICEDGLRQDRGQPIHVTFSDSTDWSFDFHTFRQLNEAAAEDMVQKAKQAKAVDVAKARDAYIQEYRQTTGGTADDAERALEFIERKLVPGSIQIHLDSGAIIPAWTLLVDAQLPKPQYKEATLGDPFEPEYGRCKAKIFYTAKGRVLIHSFAHGEATYTVIWDCRSILQYLKSTPFTQIIETFGSQWWRIMIGHDTQLNAVELDMVLHYLHEAEGKIRSLPDLRQSLEKAFLDVRKSDLDRLIDDMNREFAVVNASGSTAILQEQRLPGLNQIKINLMKVADFKLWFENDFIPALPGAKKQVTKAQYWLKHPRRRQYTGLGFYPNYDPPEGIYNLFRGYAVRPLSPRRRNCSLACQGKGCIAWFLENLPPDAWLRSTPGMDDLFERPEFAGCKSGWMRLIRHIYEVVCSCSRFYFLWTMDWLADTVRNGPNRGASICLRGGKGTGKGTFAEMIGEHIFGQHYLYTTDMRDLTGRFNFALADKLLVLADEAIWGGEKARESTLKGLITSNTLTVEPKNREKIVLKNHLRFIICSNDTWMIPASKDERRFFVLDVSEHRQKSQDWFLPIYEEIGAGSMGGALYDLLKWEITNDLRNPPVTEALREQAAQSMSPVEEWWELIYCGELPCNWWGQTVPRSEITATFQDWCKDQGLPTHYWTSRRVLPIFRKLAKQVNIIERRSATNGSWCIIFPEKPNNHDIQMFLEGRNSGPRGK